MRRGQTVATKIYMFGRLAPDGRMAGADQASRILPEPGPRP